SSANTVTLGPKEYLTSKNLFADGANWLIDNPQKPFKAKIKIRYNNKGQSGTVTPLNDSADSVKVEFDQEVSAVTPGQTAVFYIEQENKWQLAGGAWIKEPEIKI
ncbi:MAG: hypothetical protein PHF37_10800, partial [Phycisphaerae bacterium]|nr:hypothetical protein [Phycisphaerae bacterium]